PGIGGPEVGEPARGEATSTVQVAGLYAEVLVDGQAVDCDTLDDDALDEIEDVVERVVARAHEEGHVLALRTGTSAMACCAVGDESDAQATMARMLDFARSLAGELRGRSTADVRIELAMYLDLGEAQRSGAGASQTLSGPFIEARAWLASPPAPGTWMSRSVVERVKHLSCEEAWRRLEDD